MWQQFIVSCPHSNLIPACKYTCHKTCIGQVTLDCDGVMRRAAGAAENDAADRISSGSPPIDKVL